MSNRLIECGCGCTSTNTVRVHAGYRSTTMDCGKQYVECSSCHEPLEFYDNESWRFDEHLLESKEEKDLQGGPEARLKAWICNMQFTRYRVPGPEATCATTDKLGTVASLA